jgi:hypothetical protein
MLAATARDGTFRIWDTAPRLPRGPRLHFDDTHSRLTALAFTPDGDSLVTGGPQDTAIVWDLDPERLIDRACDLAGRNLTRGEWELYMPEGTPYRKTCPQWPEPPDGRKRARCGVDGRTWVVWPGLALLVRQGPS